MGKVYLLSLTGLHPMDKEIVKKALINWALCGECTDNRLILKSVRGPVSSLLFWKQIFWVVSHLRVLQVWAPFHPLVYFLFPLFPITESCNCSELLSLFALKGFEFCTCLMWLLPSWLKFLEVFTSLRAVSAVVLWVLKGRYLYMVLWLSFKKMLPVWITLANFFIGWFRT